MFSEHQIGFGKTDIFGPHDLVGAAVLEHSILVDARLVGEGIAADDRFVALNIHAGDFADESTGRYQPLGLDPRTGRVKIASGAHRHDDFFERAVSCTLTDAVDGAFDLEGSCGHSR